MSFVKEQAGRETEVKKHKIHGRDMKCVLCKIFVRKFRRTGHRSENNMHRKSDLIRVGCLCGLDLCALQCS